MFSKTIFLCSIIFLSINGIDSKTPDAVNYLPTVMWHGMGDSCCYPFSMGRIKELIEDRLPGIYVYSVMIGSNVIEDTEHGYLGNVNDQIEEVCAKISNDAKLQRGFNAIGFSQGSQFLRGVAQRCSSLIVNNLIGLGGQHQGVFGLPNCGVNNTFCEEIRQLLNNYAYLPRALVQRCSSKSVRNFISIGGQHQGIFGLPHCPTSPSKSRICEYIRKILNWSAYESSIQNHLVQAQYWHDPLDEETYKNYSIFLADINNEKTLNEEYKSNLMKLSNLVMVKFLQDSMVVPVESEWFGFYAPGQDKEVLALNKTTLYKEDRLGLKSLDECGKLQFLSVDGDHLGFTDEWFLTEIVDNYLATEVV